MSDNELRKQIMSMIRNSNLDETMFSVGIGEDYDKQRNRFVYDFSNKKNKEAIRYALKYFKKYDICLI